MKVRQKNLRLFAFTLEGERDEESMLTYINDNKALLERYTIAIEGDVSEKSIAAIRDIGYPLLVNERITQNRVEVATVETQSEKEELPARLVSYNRPIRSGSEIDLDDDIVLFKPINSGAKVVTAGCAIMFGLLNGVLEVNGEYAIIHQMGSGQLLFQKQVVPMSQNSKIVRKVSLKEGELLIEEL
jgi:septum site-determining protein MinC